MKTKKSFFYPRLSYFIWLGICPLLSFSQIENQTTEDLEQAEPRPAKSDAASIQLIKNHLTVTGGRQAHLGLRNVRATGTIKESTLVRNFDLLETLDGKRHLSFSWTHLGRKHRVLYVHDGLQTWTQVLEPQKQEARPYTGADALHFTQQRWLLQPFTLPLLADYVFKYQGAAKVNERPAHLVKGYGKKDRISWFYFDKEKSLLTRWGGEGQVAGSIEPMDYRATKFKSVDGRLLPSRIDLLVEDAAFGYIDFEQIEINQDMSDISFDMPQSMVPTLRQRPAARN